MKMKKIYIYIVINILLFIGLNSNSEAKKYKGVRNKIKMDEKFLGTYDKKTKKFYGFFIHLTSRSQKRIYVTSSISKKYKAGNLRDGDIKTCWATSINGGIGEQLLISGYKNSPYPLSQQNINGLSIYNGYCKSKGLYYKNNRIKKLRIDIYRVIMYPVETDNGLRWYTLNKDINLIYTKKVILPDKFLYENKIYFKIDLDKDFNKTFKDKGITPDYMFLLTIEDIYKGTKYNDLCVSEIKFIYK